MPKAAREVGAVTLELPLGKIAAQIAQFAGARSAPRQAAG
jgi:chemotaxis response regulator CheB